MDLLAVGIALPWVVAAAGCYAGYQLLQQNRRMIEQLEKMEDILDDMTFVSLANDQPGRPRPRPLDSPAPPFELPDLDGRPVSLEQFKGRRLVLVFFSPQCNYCVEMLPDLANLPAEGREGGPVPLLIARGDAEKNRLLARAHGLRCTVLLDAEGNIGAAYGIHGTPTGYLIDEQGTIASDLMAGVTKVLALTDPSWVPGPREAGEGGTVTTLLGMPRMLSSRDGNGKATS
jgi:peroxiredoxin